MTLVDVHFPLALFATGVVAALLDRMLGQRWLAGIAIALVLIVSVVILNDRDIEQDSRDITPIAVMFAISAVGYAGLEAFRFKTRGKAS